MKEKEQVELTINPVNPTLEAGDIFMSEARGEIPAKQPQAEAEKEEKAQIKTIDPQKIEAAKAAWEAFNKGKRISIAEKRTQAMLIERGAMPVAGGDFTNEENADKSEDVKNEEAEGREEISDKEEEVLDTIESAEDFYSALNELIKISDYNVAKEAIDADGEDLVRFLAEGLSRKSYEKCLEELKQLKDLSTGETKERFIDIVENIRREREALGLEDPLTKLAPKISITEEEKQELERLQDESLEREQGVSGDHFNSGNVGESVPVEDSEEEQKGEMSANSSENILRMLSMLENYGKNPELDTQIMAELFGGSELGGALGGMVASLFPQNSPRVEQLLGEFKKHLQSGNVEYVQKAILNLNDQMLKRNLDSGINSIEGLARYIVEKQNKELWGVDGEYPIIEKNGQFNQKNFFLWLRQQSGELHWDNPNSKMAPLEAVGIQNVYGSFIPIYLMTRFKEQYLRDETTGKVITDLAEDLKYEAFMFGDWRNAYFIHRQAMGSDKELPKVEQELHATNNLTRGRNLRFVYSLPAEYGKEGDTRLGDAIRFGNDFYSNLSDSQVLSEEILQGYEFTIEDFKNAMRVIKDKLDWDDELDNYGDIYDAASDKFTFKDRKGRVRELFHVDGKIDMDVFSAYLNFYKSPQEPSSNIALVRELVRIKMAQKYGGEIDPKTQKRAIGVGVALSEEEKSQKRAIYEKEVSQYGENEARRRFLLRRKAERINVDYAEIWAFSAQLPFGAADGDVRSIGANADRKAASIQDYLLKQSGENRGGATGIPEVMGVFRGLTTNYWSGLKTESGESPHEIFRKIREVENNNNISPDDKQRLKHELVERLSFKEDAEKNFTNNNRVRAFEIFHQQSESKEAMDLEKIVTWSLTEGLRLHMSEFQDQMMEKLIKPRRYAILNADIKYSQIVRRQVGIADDEDFAVYDSCTLAEKQFGKEVLVGINMEDPNYIDSYEGKVELFKNSIRADVAGQLRLHSQVFGIGEYWGYQRRELFIDALKTLRALEKDEDGRFHYSKDPEKRFFSETDIAWIRKNSGSEVWRMLMIDGMKKGGEALASGSWAALMKFIEALMK